MAKMSYGFTECSDSPFACLELRSLGRAAVVASRFVHTRRPRLIGRTTPAVLIRGMSDRRPHRCKEGRASTGRAGQHQHYDHTGHQIASAYTSECLFGSHEKGSPERQGNCLSGRPIAPAVSPAPRSPCRGPVSPPSRTRTRCVPRRRSCSRHRPAKAAQTRADFWRR